MQARGPAEQSGIPHIGLREAQGLLLPILECVFHLPVKYSQDTGCQMWLGNQDNFPNGCLSGIHLPDQFLVRFKVLCGIGDKNGSKPTRWKVDAAQQVKKQADRGWVLIRYAPAIALICCIAFACIYLIVGSIGWGEPAARESAIGEIGRWCERVHPGVIREPANTLSNLGFILSGLAMFWVLSRDKDLASGHMIGLNPVSVTFAAAVVWLGPGSMLMHGTNTAWGASADNLSMVMYILIPWLLNLTEMGRFSSRQFFLTYFVLVVGYAVLRELFGSRLGINLNLFSVSIGLWVISEALLRFYSAWFRWLSGFVGFIVAAVFGILPAEMLQNPAEYWWVLLFWLPAVFCSHPPRIRRRYTPWYFAGGACFVIAFAIWQTGRPHNKWCQPDSLIQAHAIWHLLTAASTWCFFMFLRTERFVSADESAPTAAARPG